MERNFKIILIYIIYFSDPGISKYCENKFLSSSIRHTCELERGGTVNCQSSLFQVKKAYIQCAEGYYNKLNISSQILECVNGEWSNEVMECSPECVESPDIFNISLINDNNIKFPEWYTEIIRKKPEENQINRIPGVILNSTRTITFTNISDYFYGHKNLKDFFVRIFNTKSDFIDLEIGHSLILHSTVQLFLFCDNIIKFNNKIKPVCIDSKNFDSIPDDITNYLDDRNLCFRCNTPRYDIPKFEVICFRLTDDATDHLYHIAPTSCFGKSDYILTRCQIGYQYSKPNPNPYLSFCFSGKWYYVDDNDCELICGEIDKNYKEFQTQLIYNGEKTDITSTPWHIGVFEKSSDTFEQRCGGTIVHSNVIISAAHCFYKVGKAAVGETSRYMIGAGKYYRNYDAPEKYSYFAGVKQIHISKNYIPTETLNDISIVILSEHLQYSSHIRPVCLDFTRYNGYSIRNGIKGYISGWGLTSRDADLSDELLTTSLTTVTNEQCMKMVNRNFRSQIIGDKFCATNEKNSTACQGDSGGGFVVKKNIGVGERYYLTGIISTGIDQTKYCSDGFITLFTNVQFYQNFIKDVISESRNVLPDPNKNWAWSISEYD